MLWIQRIPEGGMFPRFHGRYRCDWRTGEIFTAPVPLNLLYAMGWSCWMWATHYGTPGRWEGLLIQARFHGAQQERFHSEQRVWQHANRYWHHRYCTDLTESLFRQQLDAAPGENLTA